MTLAPSTDFARLETELDHRLSDEAAALVFTEARTAYRFTDEPVDEEQLRAVYDLAKWGPTAMNSQPLRMVLVQSADARARLVEHMAGNNKARTAAAPVVAVLAADHDFHDELGRTFPVVPDAREKFLDEESRIRSAHLSSGLQIGYVILAVRAAGLAAGPMGGFDAEAVDRELFPDGRHHALLVVTIGHPAPDAYRPRQPRLDYTDVVTTV